DRTESTKFPPQNRRLRACATVRRHRCCSYPNLNSMDMEIEEEIYNQVFRNQRTRRLFQQQNWKSARSRFRNPRNILQRLFIALFGYGDKTRKKRGPKGQSKCSDFIQEYGYQHEVQMFCLSELESGFVNCGCRRTADTYASGCEAK
ncbi:hypothetical protein HDU76_012830, partial [Blyttiomyces sp. JEL0837]